MLAGIPWAVASFDMEVDVSALSSTFAGWRVVFEEMPSSCSDKETNVRLFYGPWHFYSPWLAQKSVQTEDGSQACQVYDPGVSCGIINYSHYIAHSNRRYRMA